MLTGTPPFAYRGKTELACKVVLEDERPPRPRDSEKLGFTDKIWETLRRCWERKLSARPSIDVVSTCLKQAAETWVVDVPAFMLASRSGVERAMDLKEDQAKDFADKLDEARSRVVQPHLSIGILTLTFRSDTGSDRHRPAFGKDILEVPSGAMRRFRCFAGLVYAYGGVRSHREATVHQWWICGRIQGDVQGTACGSEGSQDHHHGYG